MRPKTIAVVFLLSVCAGTAFAADPPILKKSFVLPPNRTFLNPTETTTVVFTITNTNSSTGLTGLSFQDVLPAGLSIASVPGVTNSCGGTVSAPAGGSTIQLTGGTIVAAGLISPRTCGVTVRVTALALGPQTNTTTPIASVEAGNGAPAVASLLVANSLHVTYAANLNIGDGLINMTNAGTQNTASGQLTNLCANVYTFSPDEQLISCCTCPVTPAQSASLSAVEDLAGNTITPAVPNSIVVKVVATYGSACNAATVTMGNVATGLLGWTSTLHGLPTPVITYGRTETPFLQAALSNAELARMTSLCGFIQSNGSGYGICRTCRLGMLGALPQ